MSTSPPLARTEQVETLAALLSWTSGEFTRHHADAHPDHNRWSWQGDGHGEAIREQFREQAALLLDHGVTVPATLPVQAAVESGPSIYGYDREGNLYQVVNSVPVTEETAALYATLFPTTIYFVGSPAMTNHEEV